MKQLGLVVLVVVAACGSKASEREAYAVGGHLGNGSVFGPGPTCTYEVEPASAAELYDNKEGGTLLAPGKGKKTCESGHTEEFDIVAPDRLKIDGDAKLAIGKEGALRVSVFGKARELKTAGHWPVEWTVPPECGAVVKTDVDYFHGADSLDGSYHLELTGLAKGTCTVTASVVGQKATQTITVL
ncbi:MAG: hypothetical protein AB7T06_45560 [Kofleriaceae bacterium]